MFNYNVFTLQVAFFLELDWSEPVRVSFNLYVTGLKIFESSSGAFKILESSGRAFKILSHLAEHLDIFSGA